MIRTPDAKEMEKLERTILTLAEMFKDAPDSEQPVLLEMIEQGIDALGYDPIWH